MNTGSKISKKQCINDYKPQDTLIVEMLKRYSDYVNEKDSDCIKVIICTVCVGVKVFTVSKTVVLKW